MRYDVLGHSRNMIKRIQSTTESLRRDIERALKKINKTGLTKVAPNVSVEDENNTQTEKHRKDSIADLHATLHHHEDFISWYVAFLKSELAPTVSYQRHITALKAIMFIIKPSLLPGGITTCSSELRGLLVDATWFRSVLDLIMDPFDDVRETAALLLMSLSLENGDLELQKQIEKLRRTPTEELQRFCQKADELARRTARADHSDGAARSLELLCCWSQNIEDRIQIPFTVLSSLEDKLSAAEQDLATAVLQAPVHGSFASLR